MNNPTGYKGVYPARNGRFQAQFRHCAIGGFASAWEAGVAVAQAYYGEQEKKKARREKEMARKTQGAAPRRCALRTTSGGSCKLQAVAGAEEEEAEFLISTGNAAAMEWEALRAHAAADGGDLGAQADTIEAGGERDMPPQPTPPQSMAPQPALIGTLVLDPNYRCPPAPLTTPRASGL
jgi:hypothetical protein